MNSKQIICTECDEVIAPKRVDAFAKHGKIPELCRDCQERYERDHGVLVPFAAMAISSETDEATSARERGIVAVPERALFTAKNINGTFRLTA
jgi:RNA polymerase-binding transcription factor DksA